MARSSELPTRDFTPAILKHFELKESEAAGLCPWRNRSADMVRFFPGADSAVDENLVVSSQRLATARKLGRTPTGDENALRAYTILRGSMRCGTVITRRVRGEYGLIELVLVVNARTDTIKEAYLQRLREPEPAAAALQSAAWLSQFRGLNGESDWTSVAQSTRLPADARVSARAITDAARTAMILLATAQSINPSPVNRATHPV